MSGKASADAKDPPSGEYLQLRYYEKLLGILGAGDDIYVMLAAYKNFDRQRLISIHKKAGMYLTHPDVANILGLQDTAEQEYGVTHEATEAADELVPVNLKDLEIGKRNECVVLYGQLCVKPFKFGRIYTLLEEEDTGIAVVLAIVSPDILSIDQSFARKNYPQGKKIAVKEPALVEGEGGVVFIDVDNPLSIEAMQSLPAHAVSQEKFDHWMACGNAFYEAQKWEKCIRNHTKCVVAVSKGMYEDPNVLAAMYQERWTAHMNLKRYQEALQDAEGICRCDPLNAVGVECKIQSLLSVGRYKEAFRFLECSCAEFPTEKKELFISAYRKWSFLYGWPEPNVKPDGDFIGPVEIRMTSNGCGRGLFATEDIETAQALVISRALALTPKCTEDPIKNGLLQNVKDGLSSCGDNILKLFLSHGMTCEKIPKMSDFFNEKAAVETNLPTSNKENNLAVKDSKILRILKHIAFEDSCSHALMERGKESSIFNPVPNRLYYGVWLLPSLINHSCVPNAVRNNVGEMMKIHSMKPIEKGQEITIPSFGVLVPYTLRQKYCNAMGFDCKCRRCEVEREFMKSGSKAQKLYKSYLTACESKIKEWPTQLQQLVNQVENCLKANNIEGEAWIRASFMAAYLARIVCRKKKPLKTPSKIEEENLLRAARCAGETCPGDIQYLMFCESCLVLWSGLAARGKDLVMIDYAEYVSTADALEATAIFSLLAHNRDDLMQIAPLILKEE